MNRTIAGSNKKAILVGGDTYTLEDGRIEIPPEQAKTTKNILENIEQGNFMTISVGNCKAEDVLSKSDIAKLQKNRKERKTRNALKRKEQERN